MNEHDMVERTAEPVAQAQVKHLVDVHHMSPAYAIRVVAELQEVADVAMLAPFLRSDHSSWRLPAGQIVHVGTPRRIVFYPGDDTDES